MEIRVPLSGLHCKSDSGTLLSMKTANEIDRLYQIHRRGVPYVVRWMNSWVQGHKIARRFHPMFFEEWKAEPRTQLFSMLRFIKMKAPPRVIDRALELCTFENMRKNDEQNLQHERKWLKRKIEQVGLYEERRLVRTGTTMGFKSELSSSSISWIKEYLEDNLDPYFSRYLEN
jgi:hypothetical protein